MNRRSAILSCLGYTYTVIMMLALSATVFRVSVLLSGTHCRIMEDAPNFSAVFSLVEQEI